MFINSILLLYSNKMLPVINIYLEENCEFKKRKKKQNIKAPESWKAAHLRRKTN